MRRCREKFFQGLFRRREVRVVAGSDSTRVSVKRRRLTAGSRFIFGRRHLENLLRATRSTLEFKIVPGETIMATLILR
jgi:hypothetical protein